VTPSADAQPAGLQGKIEFMHPHAQAMSCERPSDGRIELHVTDQGSGFPLRFLEHAFERFSRGNRGRDGSGAGLGLAIVETIAQAHEGNAHAANRATGGADVWLDLPSATPPAIDGQQRTPVERRGLSSSLHQTQR
jgi:signal transduction histidine kinase